MALEAVSQGQQLHPVAAQLARQLRRRGPLGDTTEDQQDPGGAPLHPVQQGAGPGVEDAAAVAALVVEQGGAVAAVDAEAVAGAAARAGQAVGVEQLHELGVAGVFVQELDQGEIHRCGPHTPEDQPHGRHQDPKRSSRTQHRTGLMSQSK
jgi:hypothetical protein